MQLPIDCPEELDSNWIGDWYCDDDTNIKECAYDGGDCCLTAPNIEYCVVCECLQ